MLVVVGLILLVLSILTLAVSYVFWKQFDSIRERFEYTKLLLAKCSGTRGDVSTRSQCSHLEARMELARLLHITSLIIIVTAMACIAVLAYALTMNHLVGG